MEISYRLSRNAWMESLYFANFSEEEGSYKSCRRICDELEVPMHGSSDYHIIREVCYAVSNRSAAIVAAGLYSPGIICFPFPSAFPLFSTIQLSRSAFALLLTS